MLRITPNGKGALPIDVRRMPAPTFGRLGRSAESRTRGGGPGVYPLLVPVDSALLRGAKVEVLEAAAWIGALPPGAALVEPVTVGKIEVHTALDAEHGKSLPRTTIELRNSSDSPVDVVLLAEFKDPKKARTLLPVLLAPGQTLEHVVRHLPVVGGGEYLGAEVQRASVVDWSLRWSDGATERRDRWTTVGGSSVPIEVGSGDERMHITWSALADDWCWPSKCEFVDIFTARGARWGPEVLTCSKVHLSPEAP